MGRIEKDKTYQDKTYKDQYTPGGPTPYEVKLDPGFYESLDQMFSPSKKQKLFDNNV